MAYLLTVRVNISEPNSSAGLETKWNEKKNKQWVVVQTIAEARAVPRPSILSSLYRLKHCIVSLLISIIYKWGTADACWSTLAPKETENTDRAKRVIKYFNSS